MIQVTISQIPCCLWITARYYNKLNFKKNFVAIKKLLYLLQLKKFKKNYHEQS